MLACPLVVTLRSTCFPKPLTLTRSPGNPCQTNRISLVVQTGKNLPAMQGTRIQSLGWEDPLEKGMATHSRILARRIPWTEEPGRLQSTESQSQTRLSNQH